MSWNWEKEFSMEILLKDHHINYTCISLEKPYEGYILYSAEDNLLDNFDEKVLSAYQDYANCKKQTETFKERYLYYQNLNNETSYEHVVIIMMNPALACSNYIDDTIKNINKYLKNKKYKSFEIVNLYPLRTPKPTDLKDVLKKQDFSKYHKFLLDYIIKKKGKSKIVAAWGGNYHKVALSILESMKLNYEEDFYAYALNKENDPRHFSNQAYNKKDKYSDFKKIKDIISELDA